MWKLENCAVKNLQFRLHGKQAFGILLLVLDAKLPQEPAPFRSFKEILQWKQPIGSAPLYLDQIPGNAQKISLQRPLLGVKLPDGPRGHRVENHQKDFLGEIFSEGNRPRHVHEEPIDRAPEAVV